MNDVNQITWLKTFLFNKERSRFRLENVLAARHLHFLKCCAARKTYMITAGARKIKRTARMLASVRKDHSIPPRVLALLYIPATGLLVSADL